MSMKPDQLKTLMEVYDIKTRDLMDEFNVSRQLAWHWQNKSIGTPWQRLLKQYFANLGNSKT